MLKILFLCTGNSCRSQMAEGWARHLKGDAIEAVLGRHRGPRLESRTPSESWPRRAWIFPASGRRLSTSFADVEFDYVVTVCDHAHENCPVFPGKAKVVHVGFDDPPRLASRCHDGGRATGPLSPRAGRNSRVCRDTCPNRFGQ